MNWGDFGLGVWSGVLGTCIAEIVIVAIVGTVGEAWSKLKARVKALEDRAKEE